MDKQDCTHLDWQAVMLLKVLRQPFGDLHSGLSVKRLYLAQYADGILSADWTLPADERFLPLLQFTGWKPERDGAFILPTYYVRAAHDHRFGVLPSGTWVLPYNAAHYQLYERLRLSIHYLFAHVEKAPIAPATLRLLARWAA